MTDIVLEDIKNSLTEASEEQRRELQKCLKDSLPDSTDNRTHIGFRASIDDKTLLRQLATSSNTSVSSLCRTTIHEALRNSFG